MSDQFNGDDFEKVDAVQADQDLSVTSTSLTGEMAEEDRYDEKTADSAVDQLADFMSGGNEPSSTALTSEPLLSFGDPEPVQEVRPSAPPAEPLKPVVETLKPSPASQGGLSQGCLMKTVDPRELVSEETMSEGNDEAESYRACPVSADQENCDSESGSVISSSDNEYSSSAEDSDTESSSSESEARSGEETMDTSSLGNEAQPVYVDNVNSDHSDMELDTALQTGGLEKKLEGASIGSLDPVEGYDKMEVFGDGIKEANDIVGNDGAVEAVQCEHEVCSDSVVNKPMVEDNDQVVPGSEAIPDDSVDGNPITVDHASSTFASIGMTDEDMSSMIEKLTKDEDVDIDTSTFKLDEMPPFEGMSQFLADRAPILTQETGLNHEDDEDDDNKSDSSNNSDSEGEVVCTDSDVTDNEDDNVGEWNPSPMYEGGDNNLNDEDSQLIQVGEDSAVLGGYEYGMSPDNDDNEIQNLRSDVKGLMEEMETLTQENQVMSLPSLYPSKYAKEEEELTADQITVVHEKPVIHGKSSLSNPSRKEPKDLDPEDLCHVKFCSPTNMIFYDPDSPILERVSVELSDDLNDSDAEEKLKEAETPKENVAEVLENPSDEIPFVDDNLESEVVKDLKHVLEDVTYSKGEGPVVGDQEQMSIDDVASHFTQGVIESAQRAELESIWNNEGITDVNASTERKDMEAEIPAIKNEEETKVSEEIEPDVSTDGTEDHVVPSDEVELRHKGKSHMEHHEHHRPNSFDERKLSDDYSKYRRSEIGSMIIHDVDNLPLTFEEGEILHVETTQNVQSEVSEDIDKVSVGIVNPVECTPESVESETMVIGQDEPVVQDSLIIEELTEELGIVENVVTDDTDKLGKVDSEINKLDQKDDEFLNITESLINDDVQPSQVDNPELEITSGQRIEPLDEVSEALTPEVKAEHQTLMESDSGQVIPSEAAETILISAQEQLVECEEREVLPELVEAQESLEISNENSIESSIESIDESMSKTPEASCTETVVESVPILKDDVLDKVKEVKSLVEPKLNEFEPKLSELEPKLSELKEDKRVTFSDNVVDEDVDTRGRRPPVTTSIQKLAAMLKVEVLELLYWRDVKKTGVVFGSMLVILVSLACFTLLSVLAYLSLAILTVTLSFRVYKSVMAAVQKTSEGHPFKNLLSVDLQLRKDVVTSAAEKVADNINNLSSELRRLFLVQDYIDSLKFGLLLWLMTYVGSWFNGMTLVILAVVAVFTLPKVYDVYREPIDQNVNLVRAQLNTILTQVTSKIPFPKKKQKTQ